MIIPIINSIRFYFEHLEPFQNVNDIPYVTDTDDFLYCSCIIPNLIRCGAISENHLVLDSMYLGKCIDGIVEAKWVDPFFIYQTSIDSDFIQATHFAFQSNNIFIPFKKID